MRGRDVTGVSTGAGVARTPIWPRRRYAATTVFSSVPGLAAGFASGWNWRTSVRNADRTSAADAVGGTPSTRKGSVVGAIETDIARSIGRIRHLWSLRLVGTRPITRARSHAQIDHGGSDVRHRPAARAAARRLLARRRGIRAPHHAGPADHPLHRASRGRLR